MTDAVVRREWHSRTALMRRVETEEGEFAVKVPWAWVDFDPIEVAAAHRAWGSLLAEIQGVECPPATASVRPRCVTMPWIQGTHLSALIRRGEDNSELIHRAGRALAALHEEADVESSLADTRKTRGKLLLPLGPVRANRPVQSAGDFSPYNVIVDSRGVLHLIDVEARSRPITAHRDLAWFLDWYRRSGGREPEAFLRGYEEQSGNPFNRDDRRLIATFLVRISALEAGKLFRARRWSAAVKYASTTAYWWAKAL